MSIKLNIIFETIKVSNVMQLNLLRNKCNWLEEHNVNNALLNTARGCLGHLI